MGGEAWGVRELLMGGMIVCAILDVRIPTFRTRELARQALQTCGWRGKAKPVRVTITMEVPDVRSTEDKG